MTKASMTLTWPNPALGNGAISISFHAQRPERAVPEKL